VQTLKCFDLYLLIKDSFLAAEHKSQNILR